MRVGGFVGNPNELLQCKPRNAIWFFPFISSLSHTHTHTFPLIRSDLRSSFFCVCIDRSSIGLIFVIRTVLMRVLRFQAFLPSSMVFPEPYPHQASCNRFCSRRRLRVFNCINEKSTESKVKKARLSARKQERVKIPNYSIIDGEEGKLYPFREFLSHPSGIEALLNKHALQSVEQLDATTYRCTLPPLSLLNFEVSPVIDLRVTPTDEDCMVEMLSCKFEGSEIMKRQNEHFSAEMSNYITWCTEISEPYLDVDVNLDLTLEIYTRPFSLLPTSAVEVPGNIMMQALVDRLVPLLLQQLIQDYEKWINQNPQDNLIGPNP